MERLRDRNPAPNPEPEPEPALCGGLYGRLDLGTRRHLVRLASASCGGEGAGRRILDGILAALEEEEEEEEEGRGDEGEGKGKGQVQGGPSPRGVDEGPDCPPPSSFPFGGGPAASPKSGGGEPPVAGDPGAPPASFEGVYRDDVGAFLREVVPRTTIYAQHFHRSRPVLRDLAMALDDWAAAREGRGRGEAAGPERGRGVGYGDWDGDGDGESGDDGSWLADPGGVEDDDDVEDDLGECMSVGSDDDNNNNNYYYDGGGGGLGEFMSVGSGGSGGSGPGGGGRDGSSSLNGGGISVPRSVSPTVSRSISGSPAGSPRRPLLPPPNLEARWRGCALDVMGCDQSLGEVGDGRRLVFLDALGRELESHAVSRMAERASRAATEEEEVEVEEEEEEEEDGV